MIVIDLNPILFRWDDLALGWHGLLLTFSFVCAYFVVVSQAKRLGLVEVNYSELMLWAGLSGYLGARILHVIDNWSLLYAAHPFQAFLAYRGGLSLFGGLIGGTGAILVYTRRKKIPFWQLMDAIGVGIPVGEIVGRVGCTINGDVYGIPTGGNWGLVYTNPAASLPSAYHGIPLFPVATAIQLWCLLLLLSLLVLRSKIQTPGKLFWTSAVLYSLGRFLIGAWQPGTHLYFGLKPNQAISLLVLIILMVVGWQAFRSPGKAKH